MANESSRIFRYKAYLIGAGPGDLERLTRNAARARAEADFVLAGCWVPDHVRAAVPAARRAARGRS